MSQCIVHKSKIVEKKSVDSWLVPFLPKIQLPDLSQRHTTYEEELTQSTPTPVETPQPVHQQETSQAVQQATTSKNMKNKKKGKNNKRKNEDDVKEVAPDSPLKAQEVVVLKLGLTSRDVFIEFERADRLKKKKIEAIETGDSQVSLHPTPPFTPDPQPAQPACTSSEDEVDAAITAFFTSVQDQSRQSLDD